MSRFACIPVTRVALVVAALSSMVSVGTALAERPAESTVVQCSDLDLSTNAGLRALDGRIRTAAWRVCFHETTNHPGIDQQARLDHCYADAVVNALQHTKQVRQVALHRGQSQIAEN